MKIGRLMIVALLLAGPVRALAQSQELANQARKEGEIILYTTMTVGDFAHFGKAFAE